MVYEEVNKNKRNTFFLLFLFFIIITGLGYFLGELYGNYYYGVIIGFIISCFSIYTSYYHSDKIILVLTGAKPANYKFYRRLYNLVEGLSLAAGFKKPPRVYILNSDMINAFATGRNPDNSAIAVTKGALKKLNKEELEGLIAHEISHIKNYDILIGSISAVLVGTIVIISDSIKRIIFRRFGRRNFLRKINPVFIIFAILSAIIAPVAATIINFSISRQREYLADAQGVLLTRYPKGLINLLEKIKKERFIQYDISSGIQHLYFAPPSYFNSSDLFSTHPPIEKRIQRLKKI